MYVKYEKFTKKLAAELHFQMYRFTDFSLRQLLLSLIHIDPHITTCGSCQRNVRFSSVQRGVCYNIIRTLLIAIMEYHNGVYVQMKTSLKLTYSWSNGNGNIEVKAVTVTFYLKNLTGILK